MKILRLACITLFALNLAACKDGSEAEAEAEAGTDETGDGDGDNELAGGACGEETETVLDDIFVIPEGFDMAVNELLASLEGNFEGNFSWGPADGGWTVSHAGTQSPLTAALAYSGGTVRLIEVENAGQSPDGLEGGVCANYLVVDVILEFATEDGVFAESLIVPLTLWGPDSEGSPSFNHSLDLDAMMGSLGVDDFMADEGMITDVVLFGEVDAAGLTGELGMEVMVSEGPGGEGIAAFGLIAEFDAPRI